MTTGTEPTLTRERDFEGPCIKDGCAGSYDAVRKDECTCFISPPCNACVEAPLVCNECGDSSDE